MSCYMKASQETTITIPNNVDINNVTYYNILVSVGNVNWTVRRRFKEFVDLHTKLVSGQSIGRDLLPPKKVIGNRSPQFLEQRQKDLEKYLKKVLIFLQHCMCRDFIEFLEFNKYDIIYLLQDLARTFYNQSELLLQFFNKRYEFSALEMYAISERLKIPCPPNDSTDSVFDFTHVVEFCSQIERLTVRPRNKRVTESASFYLDHNSSIGTSNIIPSNLKFDLIAFKNLKTLQVSGLSVENITNTGAIRQTVNQLAWNGTEAKQINEFLLCDSVHKDDICDDKSWSQLEQLNLSDNNIQAIDTSLRLAKNLKTIVFDQNHIQNIENLSELPFLQSLSLCENKISHLNDLHLQLGGNLYHLNLSQNNLSSLKAFRKLFTLVRLDVSCNNIDAIDEVDFIASLPCLEEIILTGNPLAGTVDYRSHVLARFGDRCNDIYLDNEKGNAQEIDTALALAALKLSETCSPFLKKPSTSHHLSNNNDDANSNKS